MPKTGAKRAPTTAPPAALRAGGAASRRELSDAAAAAAADAFRQQWEEADEEEEEEEETAAAVRAPGVRGKRTRSAALQAKLELLSARHAAGDVRGFCAAFLPRDLTPAEAAEFTAELGADAERWASLGAEVAALAQGLGVKRVVGDQVSRAEFRYLMPGRKPGVTINREVVFVCVEGDWRAEG